MSGLGRALFGQVSVNLPSFLVALGGAFLALAWLELSWVVSATAFGLLLFMGAMSYLIGDAQLNQDRPKAVRAEQWLRWTILAPIGLAAFVGAVILVLGIDTAPKDSWSEQQKQLTAAFTAALTTYFTATFIKGADEADEGWVGKLVQDRFTTRLRDRFPTSETAVRDAVFHLTRSWDASERSTRATEIDNYIAGGGQVRPRS